MTMFRRPCALLALSHGLAAVLAAGGLGGAPTTAAGQTARPTTTRPATVQRHPTLAPFVDEAAARFGLPADWIWAVMSVESAGQSAAVSRAGAMGLMQLMPDTWRSLRHRLALGEDPFSPRDNILAGAAYMREMVDRFGAPGFLAAYNAGPTRYADHLATASPLPRETLAYVDRLTPIIAGPTGRHAPIAPVSPFASPLFAPPVDRPATRMATIDALTRPSNEVGETRPARPAVRLPASAGLFADRTLAARSPTP
ncbi:hypothetical protein AS593_06610 [Caulobacter vibrioides]|nr:hypothetical protein AS593_06610 [Caulobacter vibrioides]